jgi:hypothetical protein
MNAKKLESLLEKYYSGESTEEEERILRDYFNGDSILIGYEAERKIFGYFKTEKEIPEPTPGFEERIIAGVDTFGSKEKTLNFRRYLIPLIGAAASILIIAGSYLYLNRSGEMKDTFSDPQIAYLETRKILLDVSLKMNRATRELEPVGKINEMAGMGFSAINKSTKIIEKNLKGLDKVEFRR